MPPPRGQTRSRVRSTPETRLRNAAQKLGKTALETLAALMNSDETPATIRLAAAREVLDRGHGRPKLGGLDAGSGGDGGLIVIKKLYSDVTPEEEARAAEGEA